MRIREGHEAGFTLVEIMIVVAIIGLLAAIAVPSFARARGTAQAKTCLSNLRQIDSAIQQWALESKAATSATVLEADLTPFLGRRQPAPTFADAGVECPAGGNYNVTTFGEPPTCTVGAPHQLP